jgi:nitrite reductase/ring-hydroxylating ferredoxin subunit
MQGGPVGKLPRGVEVDGKRVRIDLREHPQLLELDGVLELPSLHLILVRGKRQLRAMCSFCPHKPDKERIIERMEGKRRPAFVCHHHGWTWDRKGRATDRAEAALGRYEVEVRGDEVVVTLE